jgi:hypothetical protein
MDVASGNGNRGGNGDGEECVRRSIAGVFVCALVAFAVVTVACSGAVPEAPDDGAQHIVPGQAHPAYSTAPATSGPHWSTPPVAGAPLGGPVKWGNYGEPIPDEAQVHNLEHGGLGLHYDCPSGCPDVVASLRKLVPSNPSQFVMSPYAKMQSRIAVTAWRRVMYLEAVDEAKIKGFIAAYKDKAPESVKGNLF